jgi:membrane fusion protein (multidrug efflux system)
VELDEPAKELRPGMFGSVSIVLADHPGALLLPTSVLVPGGKPAVLIVQDGRARRKEIEVGYNDGVRMQVTRGLIGSEEVISDGKNLVQDGQPVEIAK